MSRCSGCKDCTEPALYCSKECQIPNWPVHKLQCPSVIGTGTGIGTGAGAASDSKSASSSSSWEDPYRKGKDGSNHMETLELVTWDFEDMGWGGTYKNESEDLKSKFEGERQQEETSEAF